MFKNNTLVVFLVIALVVIGVYGYFVFQKKDSSRRVPDGNFIIAGLNVGTSLEPAWVGFKSGMEILGYHEGKNVEYRYFTNIQGGEREYADITKEILKDRVHLLVGIGIGAAKGAQIGAEEAGSDTPILFINVSDPVGNGLVADVSAPGGNITGITPANEIVSGRRLEILKEAVPGLKRIFFPYNNPKTSGLEEVRKTALSLGITLEEYHIGSAAEILPYLNGLAVRPGDGFLRSTDQIMAVGLPNIIKFGIEKKIPVADSSSSGVKLGAFMGYGANFEDEGRQGARLADKILGGIHPRSIPVELPERFEFAVNLQTAEKIGVDVPKNILERVDVVYP